jgi:UDP-N-acetylmuramoyl-L-alanyl-D-glutamate--2,6-diaminopimelate ligase
VHFSTCIDRLRETGLLVNAWDPLEINFDRLTIDSRAAGPSDCFVAIKGTQADGHLFIDKAVKNGAIAIVSEAGPDTAIANRQTVANRPSGPAFAHVTNTHLALAELASLVSGDPGRRLKMIATTGTNGKTTVATLIAWVLNQTGVPAGFIGTTGYRYGSLAAEASHTTPSAILFHDLLSSMHNAGMVACSLEASSHAIDQARLRVSDVDVAVFTNLSRDHLDYHHTFDAYTASKKLLFDGINSASSAVTNVDDARGMYMVSDTKGSVITYGQSAKADVRYVIRTNALAGLVIDIDGVSTTFKLSGSFNAANLAAAYSACLAMGVEADLARKTLASCPPVTGRMETFQTASGTTVIIDYAHTPDALENVLGTVRESLPKGSKLWCVFGCGGDRDRGKRPEMGAIAEKMADYMVVTSDNPRTEDAASILEDIRQGVKRDSDAIWIVDRREAIHEAIRRMKHGDTIVLAGKGHETYQVIGTEKIHFDDREQAVQAFISIGQQLTLGQAV